MEFERDAGELGGRRHWARYKYWKRYCIGLQTKRDAIE